MLRLFGAPRSHSRHPVVIRRPHSYSTPGNCAPLAPLVTPLVEILQNAAVCTTGGGIALERKKCLYDYCREWVKSGCLYYQHREYVYFLTNLQQVVRY